MNITFAFYNPEVMYAQLWGIPKVFWTHSFSCSPLLYTLSTDLLEFSEEFATIDTSWNILCRSTNSIYEHQRHSYLENLVNANGSVMGDKANSQEKAPLQFQVTVTLISVHRSKDPWNPDEKPCKRVSKIWQPVHAKGYPKHRHMF